METQRHLFSLQEDIHYLNNAYKAPLLKACEAAALKSLVRDRNPIDIGPDDFFEVPDAIRKEFAHLVNCKPSQVALIPASSYGLNAAIQNVPFQNGQHALTIENEFPSDIFALERWCSDHQSELKFIRPNPSLPQKGAEWNERILAAISEETAVLVMSSVHWMNGTSFDLERIGRKCAETNTYFIVDGTQSVGARSMDVQRYQIDALVCAGYKWLMGPYSLGLAFYSEKFNDGIPLEETWMNRTNAKDFSNLTTYEKQYTPDAGRYNMGETSNFTLAPMLLAALQQLNQWGVENIESYTQNLILPLKEFLVAKDIQLEDSAYFSSHLFGISLPEAVDLTQVKEAFAQEKVYVSVRGNFLRVSVNVFNTPADIDKLIQVLNAFI